LSQNKKLQLFKNNLLEGIDYYVKLFSETNFFKKDFVKIQNQLTEFKNSIFDIEIPQLELQN
jgi:hypothetical protein